MDNVCDAIAHSVFVMVVAIHFGGVCAAASLIGVTAIMLRAVTRLNPRLATDTGSPTNELIRHILFVLVLTHTFEFNAAPFLIVAFLLLAAGLVPITTPVIAACFILSFLYSLAVVIIQRDDTVSLGAPAPDSMPSSSSPKPP